jgi:uncharacterized protein (TIGR03083 family)
MKTDALIETLHYEGKALAAAAQQAGDDAVVVTCPDWRVVSLLRHISMVHRWATRFVAEGLTTSVPAAAESDLSGAELLAWFREGHQSLVDALRTAPEDLECWTFLPHLGLGGRGFWARRQLHETTVHRVDAESALGSGIISPVATEVAVDGIEELLTGFHSRHKSRVRTDEPCTLRISATDTDASWTVSLSQDPPRTVAGGGGRGDCELRGSAQDLYLALWNRLPYERLEVIGDPAPAALWRRNSAVTWG